MDDKTQGVVVQSLRYGDSSLIVKVFTRSQGIQSYMVKGAFNHSSKSRAALFQNLNIIHFVSHSKPNGGALGYLKDVQLAYVYQSIPFEIKKSAILMYVAELLSKTLTGQEKNEPLYDFIIRSMEWLDLVDCDYANFPLYFTIELTRHLGFYPHTNYQPEYHFDMLEGLFVQDTPPHPYYLDADDASLLARFLDTGIDTACLLPLQVTQRRDLLEGIITFMRLHAPVMKNFQSHEVLKAVLQ